MQGDRIVEHIKNSEQKFKEHIRRAEQKFEEYVESKNQPMTLTPQLIQKTGLSNI